MNIVFWAAMIHLFITGSCIHEFDLTIPSAIRWSPYLYLNTDENIFSKHDQRFIDYTLLNPKSNLPPLWFNPQWRLCIQWCLYMILSSSKKPGLDEAAWEAERRQQRSVWLPGCRGMTEAEAAQRLLQEARWLLAKDLQAMGIQAEVGSMGSEGPVGGGQPGAGDQDTGGTTTEPQAGQELRDGPQEKSLVSGAGVAQGTALSRPQSPMDMGTANQPTSGVPQADPVASVMQPADAAPAASAVRINDAAQSSPAASHIKSTEAGRFRRPSLPRVLNRRTSGSGTPLRAGNRYSPGNHGNPGAMGPPLAGPPRRSPVGSRPSLGHPAPKDSRTSPGGRLMSPPLTSPRTKPVSPAALTSPLPSFQLRRLSPGHPHPPVTSPGHPTMTSTSPMTSILSPPPGFQASRLAPPNQSVISPPSNFANSPARVVNSHKSQIARSTPVQNNNSPGSDSGINTMNNLDDNQFSKQSSSPAGDVITAVPSPRPPAGGTTSHPGHTPTPAMPVASAGRHDAGDEFGDSFLLDTQTMNLVLEGDAVHAAGPDLDISMASVGMSPAGHPAVNTSYAHQGFLHASLVESPGLIPASDFEPLAYCEEGAYGSPLGGSPLQAGQVTSPPGRSPHWPGLGAEEADDSLAQLDRALQWEDGEEGALMTSPDPQQHSPPTVDTGQLGRGDQHVTEGPRQPLAVSCLRPRTDTAMLPAHTAKDNHSHRPIKPVSSKVSGTKPDNSHPASNAIGDLFSLGDMNDSLTCSMMELALAKASTPGPLTHTVPAPAILPANQQVAISRKRRSQEPPSVTAEKMRRDSSAATEEAGAGEGVKDDSDCVPPTPPDLSTLEGNASLLRTSSHSEASPQLPSRQHRTKRTGNTARHHSTQSPGGRTRKENLVSQKNRNDKTSKKTSNSSQRSNSGRSTVSISSRSQSGRVVNHSGKHQSSSAGTAGCPADTNGMIVQADVHAQASVSQVALNEAIVSTSQQEPGAARDLQRHGQGHPAPSSHAANMNVSQPSSGQAFCIVDVAADSELFTHFLQDWSSQQCYSLCLACMPQPTTSRQQGATIAARFNAGV